MDRKSIRRMELEFFIWDIVPFLWKYALVGSIFLGAILSVWGYQNALKTIPVDQLVGDIRIEEVATAYGLEYGFKGCIGGILLGPFVFLFKLVSYLFSRNKSLT